ncbi:MAG: hypothetical protein AMXMBFR55_12470 [Gemmatimonadota bacterium]
MHRTLKREAIRPARATLRGQQRAFDHFRVEHNDVRPHQHLRGATPGARYRPSARPYPSVLPAITYPSHFTVVQDHPFLRTSDHPDLRT